MTDAERKVQENQAKRQRYFAFLDKRIAELHRAGVPGVAARRQADVEYVKR